MWRSDFSMDHFENALLADEMGVIVGASHHEPCCRSGGEFQALRKRIRSMEQSGVFCRTQRESANSGATDFFVIKTVKALLQLECGASLIPI